MADLAASVIPNFPQTACCSGLQKSLQQEWQFVQRVKEGVGPKFADVELALSKTFLLTLFGDDSNEDDPRPKFSCLLAKWATVAIPDPPLLLTRTVIRACCSAPTFWPPSKPWTLFDQI